MTGASRCRSGRRAGGWKGDASSELLALAPSPPFSFMLRTYRRPSSLPGGDLAQLGPLLGGKGAGDQLGVAVFEGVLDAIYDSIGAQYEERRRAWRYPLLHTIDEV